MKARRRRCDFAAAGGTQQSSSKANSHDEFTRATKYTRAVEQVLVEEVRKNLTPDGRVTGWAGIAQVVNAATGQDLTAINLNSHWNRNQGRLRTLMQTVDVASQQLTLMAEKACTHTQPQIAADNEGWQSSNQTQRVLGHGSHESPTAQVASHLGGKTQQAEGRPTPRGQSDRVVPFLKEPRTAEARANEQRMQAVIDGVTQEHGGCHAVIDGR